MEKVLILAMLCIASTGCVELENICSGDSFEYEGVQVNAIHRVRFNVTLQPYRKSLINDSINCDPTEFKNKSNFWEALQSKHE